VKSGSADDPFEDDGEPESVREQGTPVAEDEDSGSGGVPPYALRRGSVKENRGKVPIWLQEENEELQSQVKDEVEEILGYEVYQTDFKEAAHLEGLVNPEAIADRLDEWGCEFA